MLNLLWLCVVAYGFVQVLVLWRPSGPSRVAAALPLVVMIPIFVLTLINLLRGSNLWPLLLLLISPFALLYVVVAFFVLRKQSPPVT
jgi:hypothetical protein